MKPWEEDWQTPKLWEREHDSDPAIIALVAECMEECLRCGFRLVKDDADTKREHRKKC